MKGYLIFAAIVLVIGGAAYAGNRHDERMWRDYKRVRPGMTIGQAEAILGKPSWQDRCGAKFPYGHDKSCVTQLGYPSAFVPLNPLFWVVEVDARPRVISSDWIASP